MDYNSAYESLIKNKKVTNKVKGMRGMLGNLLNYGMLYEPKTKELREGVSDSIYEDEPFLYDYFSSDYRKNQERKQREKTFNLNLEQRRYELEDLAEEPEIQDILELLTDELIVKQQNEPYHCTVEILEEKLSDYKDSVIKELKDIIDDFYPKLYRMLGFYKNGAWKQMYKWLETGKVCKQIVFDNLENPKDIVNIIDMNPHTIEPYFKDGVRYWIQKPDNRGRGGYGITERHTVFTDAQIIYIDFNEGNSNYMSYLERLKRSFNIYRIIERTQINWWVSNSQFRQEFTVPTTGLSEKRAARKLSSVANSFRDEILFDDKHGKLSYNGEPTVPFNRTYFFSEGKNGRITQETVGGDGPDLNDIASLKFFENRMYKMSRMPSDYFDENDTGWQIDPLSKKRKEVIFSNYVNRIREKWDEAIMKPVTIKISIANKKLASDYELLNNIIVRYNKLNVFSEMADLQLLVEKIRMIEDLSNSLVMVDPEGREHKYWSSTYLAKKYLNKSSEELEENKEQLMVDLKMLQERMKIMDKMEDNVDDYGDKLDAEDQIEKNISETEEDKKGIEDIVDENDRDMNNEEKPFYSSKSKKEEGSEENDGK